MQTSTTDYHFCAGERHRRAIHKKGLRDEVDALQDVRTQLAQTFIAHKADLGSEAACAIDEAILGRVDAITDALLRSMTTALTEGDADWLSRHVWFTRSLVAVC
jgi:hypothetical protein